MESPKRKLRLIQSKLNKLPEELLESYSIGKGGRSETVDETVDYWDEALDSLQERSFETVDAAVDAIISEVLKKIEIADSTEARHVLQTIFMSDPELERDLRRVLSIREH